MPLGEKGVLPNKLSSAAPGCQGVGAKVDGEPFIIIQARGLGAIFRIIRIEARI
ncbi:MAG TPA: hypothetical protein VGZ47_20215 [Gemmataceae bacterium]|jgi:hypothetical protein|nr:hypothetical protein [Gemmataceae bacterium]